MASNNGLSRNFGQDDLITIIVQESDNPFATARDNATAAANNSATETTAPCQLRVATWRNANEYFKNALTGNWEEAQTKTVTLTDISRVTFRDLRPLALHAGTSKGRP
ncbi:hypothetical protein E8E13_008649 [Curvularia kusanoi]|uniref:Uncharacterized protein n=1 Tax=Curvularia kusanoi TaxID=90978 RepID=A0A9P4T9T0_CURKU|nr:hypothetical protein E8E13_008649 [Curvularia kusanoi]